MPLDGRRGRITLAEERHFRSGEAHTRIVSAARIRLDPPKSTRLFKGLICSDICEFESYHPSHAVWSLWEMSGLRNYAQQRPCSECRRLHTLGRKKSPAWHAV